MYILPVDQVERLLACVDEAFPCEAAGLLLGRHVGRYTVLTVASVSSSENTPLSFRIRNADIAQVASSLKGSTTKICGCFHSHVLGDARPSRTDREGAEEFGSLWLIYSVRFRRLKLFRWHGTAFFGERFRVVPPIVVLPHSKPDHNTRE